MRKSFIALGALCASALVLTGCSTSAPSGDSNAESKLVVAIDNPALLEPVVAEFEKVHPEIAVTVAPIGSNGYMQIMQTQLASGTAPDVFMVYPGTGEPMTNKKLGERGLIKTLTGDWISDVPESMLPLLQDNEGNINTLPGTLAGIGIAYNDQALAAIGAQPATTFPEVLALCEVAVSNGTNLFSVGQKDAWVGQIVPWALAVPLVYGPNPDFSAELIAGKATFTDSAWVDTFDKTQQLIDAQCFNDGSVGTGWDDAQKMLADGKVLASVNYGVSNALAGMTPDGTTYTFSNFPATDSADDKYMPISTSKGFAINAKTQNPEAAETFMEFLASDAGQTAFAVASGLAPTLPAPSYTPDAGNTFMLERLEAGDGRPFPHLFWENAGTIEVLYTEMQNLYNGGTTPADMVAKLDTAFNKK